MHKKEKITNTKIDCNFQQQIRGDEQETENLPWVFLTLSCQKAFE